MRERNKALLALHRLFIYMELPYYSYLNMENGDAEDAILCNGSPLGKVD